MSTKHTPFKWTLEPPPEIDVFTDKPGVTWAIKDETGRIVSLAANEREGRMLSSAPAMFEALKEVMTGWSDNEFAVLPCCDCGESLPLLPTGRCWPCAEKKARAALAQAEPAEALRLAGEEVKS